MKIDENAFANIVHEGRTKHGLTDHNQVVWRKVIEAYEAAKAPKMDKPIPDDGPFPPWMLDQFTGCGIDNLDPALLSEKSRD